MRNEIYNLDAIFFHSVTPIFTKLESFRSSIISQEILRYDLLSIEHIYFALRYFSFPLERRNNPATRRELKCMENHLGYPMRVALIAKAEKDVRLF